MRWDKITRAMPWFKNAYGCSQVYLMKQKSEVVDKFRELEAEVTNETGLSIGTLRADNGGEYVSGV